MTPKFSIVIPVYNVAPYLCECLDSVLAQTFTDWEAICVDDGSTDGSGMILDEYAAKDRRFRIVHQKNAGVSEARNVALDIAEGEYVGFLDGDDAIAPYLLSKVLSATCRMKGIDYISYGMHIGNARDRVNWSDSNDAMGFYEGAENAISERASMLERFAGTCGGYYRRKSVGDIRFDVTLAAREDTLFHLELLPRMKAVAEIGCKCYFYRMGRTGNSCSKRRMSQSMVFYEALEVLLRNVLGRAVDEYPEVRHSISKVVARDFALCMAGEMDLNHCGRVRYRRLMNQYRVLNLFDLEGLSWLNRIRALLIMSLGVYFQMPFVRTLKRVYKRVRRKIEA